MIINGEKRKIAMEIAYILMLMSAAMGDLKVFSVSQTRMMKAISLFIVVMAAAYLFISGRLERVKTAASFVGVYGFVLIGIIVWSIFLWIINIESIDFILRGASKFMYQFLVLLIIFSGAYLFGERAIYYILRTCGCEYANGRVQLGRVRNIGQYKFRNCNVYGQ